VKPCAVEQTVQGAIARVRVLGIVDLFDVDGCVFDFKTSSKPNGIPAEHVCIGKILSGSEINSVHTFLSRSIYDWCSGSATSIYGLACLPAVCNRIEACSWKVSFLRQQLAVLKRKHPRPRSG